MQPTVVFLPGIMGSSLGHLWSKNILSSFAAIVQNPGLIKLPAKQRDPKGEEGLDIECEVMGEIQISLLSRPICQRLRNELSAQATAGSISFHEFGYDWRQNLLKTARHFGNWLRSIIDSQDQKPPNITIIAHSMGCLVSTLAIIEGHIDRSLVQRLICVGGPFLGAPSAFRALYSTGYLKGMDWLDRLVQPRTNRIATVNAILDAFQSFPSLYQLLPPPDHKFIWKDGRIINPLQDRIMSDWAKKSAGDVHSRLSNVEKFFEENDIPVSLIFGIEPKNSFNFLFKNPEENKADSTGDTDQEYETLLGRNALFRETYANVRVTKQTQGDGTVPRYSASIGDKDTLDKYMIPGVRHSYMCQDARVVDLITSLIPKAKGYTA